MLVTVQRVELFRQDCDVLYYIVLLHCTALHYAVLYCTVLHCTALHSTVQCSASTAASVNPSGCYLVAPDSISFSTVALL